MKRRGFYASVLIGILVLCGYLSESYQPCEVLRSESIHACYRRKAPLHDDPPQRSTEPVVSASAGKNDTLHSEVTTIGLDGRELEMLFR
jgi:hypothetical protein